jgi:hypothetical protein
MAWRAKCSKREAACGVLTRLTNNAVPPSSPKGRSSSASAVPRRRPVGGESVPASRDRPRPALATAREGCDTGQGPSASRRRSSLSSAAPKTKPTRAPARPKNLPSERRTIRLGASSLPARAAPQFPGSASPKGLVDDQPAAAPLQLLGRVEQRLARQAPGGRVVGIAQQDVGRGHGRRCAQFWAGGAACGRRVARPADVLRRSASGRRRDRPRRAPAVPGSRPASRAARAGGRCRSTRRRRLRGPSSSGRRCQHAGRSAAPGRHGGLMPVDRSSQSASPIAESRIARGSGAQRPPCSSTRPPQQTSSANHSSMLRSRSVKRLRNILGPAGRPSPSTGRSSRLTVIAGWPAQRDSRGCRRRQPSPDRRSGSSQVAACSRQQRSAPRVSPQSA